MRHMHNIYSVNSFHKNYVEHCPKTTLTLYLLLDIDPFPYNAVNICFRSVIGIRDVSPCNTNVTLKLGMDFLEYHFRIRLRID